MIFGREPVLFYNLVVAAIAVAVSFGLPLSDVQQGGLLVLTLAALSFLARRKVTPVDSDGLPR